MAPSSCLSNPSSWDDSFRAVVSAVPRLAAGGAAAFGGPGARRKWRVRVGRCCLSRAPTPSPLQRVRLSSPRAFLPCPSVCPGVSWSHPLSGPPPRPQLSSQGSHFFTPLGQMLVPPLARSTTTGAGPRDGPRTMCGSVRGLRSQMSQGEKAELCPPQGDLPTQQPRARTQQPTFQP